MDRVKAVKEILVSFEEDNAQFRGIFCTMYHELATQICQHLKIKLPENPHIHGMHYNKTFPCPACVWEEALQQVKATLEKAGVEVE